MEFVMSKIVSVLKRLSRDEEGTALLEYSILLGVIAVAAITAAVAVGSWSSGKWATLCASLPGATGCT
jgi:pilus assembly protein Flp/PilA